MKTCFRCQRELPVDEFYKHPRMGDGHLGKCKECTKRDVRANRRARLAHYREFDRRRFHEDAERRQAQYEASRELERKYPERAKARTTVSNAIRDGRLVRQPCEVCRTTENVEAHHEDYFRPMDVRWLCREHHNQHHHPATLLMPNA